MALAIFFVLAYVPGAQESEQRITGRVIQFGIGSPVEGALISLRPSNIPGGNFRSPTVRTDRDGNYHFDHVADGGYSIGVSADGFVPQPDWRSRYAKDVVLHLDASTKLTGVDFQLRREAVIRGIVKNAAGKPVVKIAVGTVLRKSNGQESCDSCAFSNTQTDTNGQFILNQLPAGTYLVSVNGPAGYGANPDKGGWYHETWYPQADSAKEAVSIALWEGDERNGLEISVEREKRYQIVVWPSGPKGNPETDDYDILLEDRNFGCRKQTDGSYVIPGIPPGHYALTILARSKMQYLGQGETTFDVLDKDATVHLQAGGLGSVGGTVKWVGPSVDLPKGDLFDIESRIARKGVSIDGHGRFQVSEVLPGKYRFKPLLEAPVAIPLAVQCEGKVVSDDSPLQIGDRQKVLDCEVTLAKN